MRTEPSKHYLAVGVDSARSSLGRGLDSMTEYQIELRLMYSYDQEGYRSLEVRLVNKGKNAQDWSALRYAWMSMDLGTAQ